MIYIDNLIKEIGSRNLFSIDKLRINENDKIALIGDNGAGKTTFFKILLGLDKDYSGYFEVEREMKFLLNDSEEELEFPREIYSYANLDLADEYSPGEYQSLRLINLLSNTNDFLLIDEATSHLDIEGKDKLVESLKKRSMGFILISHDRDFINQTCNKIFNLANGEIEVFNGDYSFYLEERIKRRKFAQREYENYMAEKKRLLNIARNIKAESSKVRKTPKRMGNSEARLHKMGGQTNKRKLDKQVKAVESRINHLEVKEKPKEESPIEITIEEKEKIHSKILVRSKNLNKRYGDKIIFDKGEFQIENNSKIALLGANGSGKTSLLNMIINKEVWVHPNLKIGYYSQLGERLDSSKTILDNILESSIYDQTMTRIILARLGFKTDNVFKMVDILSDGEKAKVKLAKLITSDFNFLIMDEPTNFLDIRAIEALEELLIAYDRPILFVTHDLAFIKKIADGLLIIEDHKINFFRGNLDQYKKRKSQAKNEPSSDDFLREFRLSAINSRLSMEISKEEREKLEEEYDELIGKR